MTTNEVNAERPATARARHVADLVGVSILLACIVIGLVLLGAHNLADPDLWWDESGQFWMSLGQAHGTTFHTAVLPVWDGIQNGRNGSNADPLGFTWLLRIWIDAFGTETATLRALPFTIFVAAFVATYLIARRLVSLPRAVAAAIPLLVLTAWNPLQYSTEIRAYSLELLCVLLVAGATLMFAREPRWRTATVVIAALVLGTVFSRYTFVVASTAAVGSLIVLTLVSSRDRRQWPALAGVVVGYLATLAFAAWNMGVLGGDLPSGLTYTVDYQLATALSSGQLEQFLRVNFLDDIHVVTGTFLVVGMVCCVVAAIRRDRSWWTSPAFSLFAFVLLYEVGAAVLSAAGLIPWYAASRWSIGLYSVAALSLMGLAAAAAMALSEIGRTRAVGRLPRATTAVLAWLGVIAICWAAIAVGLPKMNEFRHYRYESVVSGLLGSLPRDVRADERTVWMVDGMLWPTFRYLVESSGNPLAPQVSQAQQLLGYARTRDDLRSAVLDAVECTPGQTTAILLKLPEAEAATLQPGIDEAVKWTGCTSRVLPITDADSLVLVSVDRPTSG